MPQIHLDLYFFFLKITGLKVIHSGKNLFCYVAHICNLVQEFNGLVSKRVDREISPFYFQLNQKKIYTLFLIFFDRLLIFLRITPT